MTRSDKAFGGIRAYDVSLVCPCKGCDIRGLGCARICESYKKYKFVLTIFNMMRQSKAQGPRASRMMRSDRIAEWRHNGCWPKG